MSSKFVYTALFVAFAPSVFASQNTQAEALDTVDPGGSIARAYDSARNRIVRTPAGHAANNAGQAWSTRFDGKGFVASPSHGDWTWGLELQAYGFEGQLTKVSGTASAQEEGNRLTYGWDGSLSEWFVNRSGGLEHGFLVQERPLGQNCVDAPLVLELEVIGGLQGEVLAGGHGVQFLGEQGQVTLTYSGLHVFDAQGTTFSAILTVWGDTLRIEVDESGAEYPLTIDPVAQLGYLKSSNSDLGDCFGTDVDISGDRIVVGAPREDSNSTGVGGDETNNNAADSGAAYVFVRVGNAWMQEAYLKASNTGIDDRFGTAVAISGDRIIVGAPNEDRDTSGVNPVGGSDTLSRSGAVYIFERIGGVWTQTAYIKAPNPGAFHDFGISVGLDGDRFAVGSPGESGTTSGIGGDFTSQGSPFGRSGAVYTYSFSSAGIALETYFKASNSGGTDSFGSALDLKGTRMVVGAPKEDSNSGGVNGDQGDNHVSDSGAVYVFDFGSQGWSQSAYIKASFPRANRRAGSFVAVDGDTVVFSDGVNTEIYSSATGSWLDQVGVDIPNGNYAYRGGLALSGDQLAIGAPGSRELGSGFISVDMFFGYNGPRVHGCVYLFDRSAGVWSLRGCVKSASPIEGTEFGRAVAMDQAGIVIGAAKEASDSRGVNGDPLNQRAPGAGAAFAIDMQAVMSTYCEYSVSNSSGWPAAIAATGPTALADNALVLHASSLPINQFGFFLSSQGQELRNLSPHASGFLCLGGGQAILRHNRASEIQFSGTSGTFRLELDLQNMPGGHGVSVGQVWNFQAWFRDRNSGYPSNVTNAITIEIQ